MILDKKIDFMGVRHIAGACSAVFVLISLGSLLLNGLQFGLDFTSGTSVRLSYSEPVVLEEVNATLQENGYTEAVVVRFGSDREIRIILPGMYVTDKLKIRGK